MMTFYLQPGRR